MPKFQIILLSIFGFFIIVGVLVFALYRGGVSGSTSIVIWGDIPSHDISQLINTPTFTGDQTFSVNYVEKSSDTIDTEFTEALARGTGPDLIIITSDKFWKNKPKLIAIPYESVTERSFKTTFVEEGELFLDSTGVYALPLVVDPIVLYYNRDLLSNVGTARPIQYWDEIYTAAFNHSKKDVAGNLISSVMALGEARNIGNAKDILSLLMLQAGTPITGFSNSELRSEIDMNYNLPISPSVAALDFYTQFSNPTKTFYSWNRSLIDAQTHFASGDSAYYLGFASELRIIANKNPTLNFGVAPVPQSRVSSRTTTFGRLRAVAISRGTKNPSVALKVASLLVSNVSGAVLSEAMTLPPARRDLLSEKPSEDILSVFYDAALQSRGWLDPDTVATGVIFRDAIESVTSGRSRTSEAIRKASEEVNLLIK